MVLILLLTSREERQLFSKPCIFIKIIQGYHLIMILKCNFCLYCILGGLGDIKCILVKIIIVFVPLQNTFYTLNLTFCFPLD